MSIEHTTPDAALDTLRAALTQLHALAAVPSADPFYAHAAEQVAAIVAGLETRAAATGEPGPNQPTPPDPGVKATPDPNQPTPPNPGVKGSPDPNQPEPPNPG
jgi:hypothetical protein